MKMDLLIRNAKLLDLDSGAETLTDVGVRFGRIELIQSAGSAPQKARRELDAKGAYLFPGFIDYHVHLFQHGSGFGMDANKLFTAGVTTAVDMGSSGYANYSAMYCSDIAGKALRLKSFINLSPVGQPGKGINEPLNEEVISVEKMREQMVAHPGEIVGVKVRISRPIVGKLGLQPLRRAVEVGEELGLPVCVHTTNPPESASAVAAILRPGDIYSHTYHGKGNTILNDDGSVQQGILDAQKRGVLMEVGNGKVNFNFSVAEKATAAGGGLCRAAEDVRRGGHVDAHDAVDVGGVDLGHGELLLAVHLDLADLGDLTVGDPDLRRAVRGGNGVVRDARARRAADERAGERQRGDLQPPHEMDINRGYHR